MKEFLIALSAVFISAGWLTTVWMVEVFSRMPIMGGIRINARKITIVNK